MLNFKLRQEQTRLTEQLRRSPVLAFLNSSPNMLGVAPSRDSNIFTAWSLERKRRKRREQDPVRNV